MKWSEYLAVAGAFAVMLVLGLVLFVSSFNAQADDVTLDVWDIKEGVGSPAFPLMTKPAMKMGDCRIERRWLFSLANMLDGKEVWITCLRQTH